jgi:inorganic triphosphatase YgiF
MIGYNRGNRRVYSCPGRLTRYHNDGSAICTLPRFDAIKLDKKINTKVGKLINDPDLLLKYFSKYVANLKDEQIALERQLKPLRVEADAVKEDMTIIDSKLEMKRITPESYKSRMSALQTKLADIESRTTDLDPTLVRKINLNSDTIQLYEHWLDSLHEEASNNYHYKYNALERLVMYHKHPSRKELPDPNDTITDLTKDAFQYFVVYPDKVELKGNINTRKSNSLRNLA